MKVDSGESSTINQSNMADLKPLLQNINNQLNQLTAHMQRLENKVDQLRANQTPNTIAKNPTIIQNEVTVKTTPTVSTVTTRPAVIQPKLVPTSTAPAVTPLVNGAATKNEITVNRSKPQTVPVNNAPQNGPAKPTESRPPSNVLSRMRMFEDMSTTSRTPSFNRNTSKSVNDLSKEPTKSKKVQEPTISIEDKTKINPGDSNKGRNEIINISNTAKIPQQSTPTPAPTPTLPTPTATSPPPPPPPPPPPAEKEANSTQTLIQHFTGLRKVSNATDVKRSAMMEQLKERLGEIKFD
ncbi:hypothetical protein CHUAL_013092 [Chamberlinius hualienensis]